MTYPVRLRIPTRRTYSVTQSPEGHQSHDPSSRIRVIASDVILQVEYHGSLHDSNGDDEFRSDEGGVFKKMALVRRVNELFGFQPKDKQVEGIRHLLYDKSDQILIPKTDFGKSIIFQALPMIREKSRHVSLVIMSLDQWQEQQVEKLNTIASANRAHSYWTATQARERITLRSVQVSIRIVSLVISGSQWIRHY